VPPSNQLTLYLATNKSLSEARPGPGTAPDSYENDPANPTPYLANPRTMQRPTEYMIDDQRWAERRADVVTYTGSTLAAPVTVSGPIDVDLWASTTGTDADFVVKVIDVWPSDSAETSPRGVRMAGYEMLVRGDIMRGKFRASYVHPEPFVPGAPTRIHFRLNDLLYTFKAGHRIMVQIQSDWFPLVDRNPNQFEDINHAKDEDFHPATISILHDAQHASSISIPLG
jgi:putative CocE/NonD family hydrolase